MRTLRELYARCRAFLMPGEEDFGITDGGSAGERQAGDCAGARGGALEIVPEFGGLLYDAAERPAARRSSAGMNARAGVDPGALQAYAAQFSEAEFAKQMKPILFEPDRYERDFRRASHSMTAPKISIEMPQ